MILSLAISLHCHLYIISSGVTLPIFIQLSCFLTHVYTRAYFALDTLERIGPTELLLFSYINCNNFTSYIYIYLLLRV